MVSPYRSLTERCSEIHGGRPEVGVAALVDGDGVAPGIDVAEQVGVLEPAAQLERADVRFQPAAEGQRAGGAARHARGRGAIDPGPPETAEHVRSDLAGKDALPHAPLASPRRALA